MATLRVPITFTQFSPYVAGTVTVRWSDPNAVSAVTDFASGTSGISSNTLSTSAATFTVVFASTSASGSDVDLTTAFNGSTGIGLTVPNDYNKNITVEVEIDANVGATSSALFPLKKTIRHQVLGVSDSVFTSSPATVQHNETEAVAGTTKSLGTYSINDVDSGANYTVNIFYNKTIGSITYNNTSFLNTSASDKDVLTTTNVTNLNSVLGDLQYKPLFIASPGTNQNALQGQTITISISSDKDSKISGGQVTVSPTIDNTLQFSKSGSAPSFTEGETTGKSLGTLGMSPTLTISGVTFKATVTYDKTKGTMTYPDTSIVTTFGDRDEISTTNLSTLNTALTSGTYLPVKFTSGEDLEEISADTVSITITSSPSLAITNPTQTVTTTVTSESEISGAATFTYVENTQTDNILSSLQVTDTADGDSGTNEVLLVVLNANSSRSFSFTESSPQSNVIAYDMSSGNHTNIGSNSLLIQGFKANLNTWLTNNSIKYNPAPEDTTTDTISIDVYRAPHGTAFDIDASQSANFSSFTKIHQGNPINVTNAGTVTSLQLQDQALSVMNYNTGTNAINSETFVDATSWGALDSIGNVLPNPRIRFIAPASANMNFTVKVENSSLTQSEFGNIRLMNTTTTDTPTTYLTNSFDASSKTLNIGPNAQGQHDNGGDAGINTLSHQNFQEEVVKHNMGTMSSTSDEETANLIYTAKTTDGTRSTSLTIPYLIVKNGSFGGAFTTTGGQPFPNNNEFAIGCWFYLDSTIHNNMLSGSYSGGATTPVIWKTDNSNYMSTTNQYFLFANLQRSTYQPSPGQTAHDKQQVRFKLAINDGGVEKGFFGTADISGRGSNVLNGNGWNHLIIGANLSGRDFECAINGKGFQLTNNALSIPSSFSTTIGLTAQQLVFPQESGLSRGHIQIHDDYEAGELAPFGSGGPMGSVGKRFVRFEADPSSGNQLITPSVRTDMHGMINLVDDHPDDGTSPKPVFSNVRGSMGGSTNASSAGGQTVANQKGAITAIQAIS